MVGFYNFGSRGFPIRGHFDRRTNMRQTIFIIP
jgi:hypothetical protein